VIDTNEIKYEGGMMRICFIGNLSSTFIKRDYEILKKHFEIDLIQPPNNKKAWIKYPSIVKNKIKKCDVVFGWFAGWHTAFPVHYAKKYGKPFVIVVGGYDAAYVPEINYGAFTNVKEKIPAKYVLENADLLLPVSEFTKKEILEKVKPKRIKVIYNGVDVEKFKPIRGRRNTIVTIGRVTKRGIKLKGLETFAETSLYFPDYDFVVIGETEDSAINRLKSINPKLVFTGPISHEGVRKWLQSAKVYCQLSYRESFGMGIAEAMSCGCIPVVTKSGAIPEVVDNTGFYVPYGDEKATAEAIKKALDAPEEMRKKARERIKNLFSLANRERKLVSLIGEIYENNGGL